MNKNHCSSLIITKIVEILLVLPLEGFGIPRSIIYFPTSFFYILLTGGCATQRQSTPTGRNEKN